MWPNCWTDRQHLQRATLLICSLLVCVQVSIPQLKSPKQKADLPSWTLLTAPCHVPAQHISTAAVLRTFIPQTFCLDNQTKHSVDSESTSMHDFVCWEPMEIYQESTACLGVIVSSAIDGTYVATGTVTSTQQTHTIHVDAHKHNTDTNTYMCPHKCLKLYTVTNTSHTHTHTCASAHTRTHIHTHVHKYTHTIPQTNIN